LASVATKRLFSREIYALVEPWSSIECDGNYIEDLSYSNYIYYKSLYIIFPFFI